MRRDRVQEGFLFTVLVKILAAEKEGFLFKILVIILEHQFFCYQIPQFWVTKGIGTGSRSETVSKKDFF